MSVNSFILIFFLIIIKGKKIVYITIRAICTRGGKVFRNVISI